MAETSIEFGNSSEGFDLARILPARLASDARAVCEVGAGANPLLGPREGYVLLDRDQDELIKAGPSYRGIIADISSPDFVPSDVFDLVFSRWTAEHVTNPRTFHTNVRRLLREGGTALHFFPTLYALPFLANRLVSERISKWIVLAMDPSRGDDGHHGKFPAYYRWCRGPTRRQIARLESCGFTVERYIGYFGHTYYRRLGLEPLADRAWQLMIRHPVPALTSYALVVMKAT